MARQVLENGVVLPAEYSDDWYDDMTSNLTKLDDVIGSDSEKLSSADVGAAALSNNYNDLDNLPTIPTVNDATLTIQKNGVDVQTFTANASSNVTANITVPTKTSDLTNDSNFVDTSNSAVASGITSAKVTSYDSHVADNDIHVTTADKNKWNNQTYVFRYSSTALVASSTNSNALLDNTDNLKVGDKVIDSNGVLFSITAIDTVNSTFTIGSALIDLALDANVVHTNEINSSGTGIIEAVKEVGGVDFNTLTTQGLYGTNAGGSTNSPENSPCVVQVIKRVNSVIQIASVSSSAYKSRYIRYCADITAQPPVWQSWVKFATDSDVVHKSGNETVAGNKTFSNYIPIDGTYLGNESSTNERTNLCLRSNRDTPDLSGAYISRFRPNKNQGALSGSDNSFISISFLENETRYTRCFDFGLTDWDADGIPQTYYFLSPGSKGALGTSSRKWQTINGVEPSSLSLPSGNSSDRLDISSYITAFDGTSNTYTPPVNGWISISANNCTEIYVFLNNLWCVNNTQPTAGAIRVMIPVLKGIVVAIRITGGSLVFARFIPCQGNV